MSFITTYFGFFDDAIGEGMFYIFVGTLGISFGTSSILALIIGVFSSFVGGVFVIETIVQRRRALNVIPPQPAGASDSTNQQTAVTVK